MSRLPLIAAALAGVLACARTDKTVRQDSLAAPSSSTATMSTPAPSPGNPMTMTDLTPILDAVPVFTNDDGGDLYADAAIAQIAALPDADRSLVALLASPDQPLARRFAAVEALLQKGASPDVATAATTAAIIEVVVQALPQDRVHNRWGLPGHSLGRLSKRLLKLPGFDVKALVPLLDAKGIMEIYGSESATIQDIRRYRVADLAAYLITQARKIAYVDDPDPAVRDRFIATLRP